MKKTLTLLSFFILLFASAFGQYQFPNPDFENWSRLNGNGDDVPTDWHTFNEADGSSAVSAAKKNHSNRVTGYGGGYALEMYAANVNAVIFNVLANGSMSTGRTHMGGITAGSSSNYNYDPSGYRWTFTGRPDSISFYSKKVSLAGQAYLKVFFHNNATFYDKADGSTEGTKYGSMLYAFSPTTGWGRFCKDVSWSSSTTPSLLLASFSTNTGAGQGSTSDKFSVDHIRCIYDKGLKTLTIGSTTYNRSSGYNSSSPLYLMNMAEYAKHDNLSDNNANGGSYTYTDPTCYDAGSIPNVAYEKQSDIASAGAVTQASSNNDYKASFTVSHTDGSTFTYYIQFKVAPTISLSNNSSQEFCAGTAIDPITVTASAGTITSSLNSGLSYNNTTHKISGTPTESGNYSVTVTSDNGCQATATGTITVNPLPTITLTNNGVINGCEGQQVNVAASGANTYSWSNGLGSEATVHPTTSGTYTVTGTNTSTNCSNTATATVTINPLPNVTLTPNATTVCTPATISLTAGGADSYTWAGIESNANPAVASAAGTYNVTVTGTNNTTGCSNTASQTVTVNQTPTVQITGNNAFCAGDSSTLSVTSTPNGATFVWSDLSTANTLKVKTAGKYYVTGTLNGCKGSDTVNVSVHEIPGIPTTTSNSICGTGQVALSASSTDGTCYWYANNTTSDILTSGNTYTPTLNTVGTMTYYVSVRSNEGCESSREPVTATAYAVPATPIVSDTAHCGAGEFILTATTAQGTTAHWFTDAGATQPVNNPNVSVSNTTPYYVYASNEHCNSDTVPMTITINEIPAKPTAISATSICNQGASQTSQLSATPAAGCVLNWFNTSDVSGEPISTNASFTTGLLSSSRKYFVVSKNNTTGCMSEVDSVTVNVYPKPGTPNVQNTTVCATGLVTLSGTAGTDANTLKWYSSDNSYLGTGTSYNANITATSTQFNVASFNSETGCEGDKRTVTVTVADAITAPTVATTVYACGGNATLSATAPSGTLNWLDASNAYLASGSTYPVSNIAAATVYKVAAIVGNCSSDTISLTVQPAEEPVAPTSEGNSRCGAGLITLTATVGDGLECRWYDNETSTEVRSENTTYTPNISGTTTYYVEAINASTQCVSATRTPVQAVMNTLPFTPTVSNVAHCGAGTYTLTAGANGNTQGGFHWYSDAEGTQEIQSSVEMTTSNTYYVAWVDQLNCRSALASLAVTINPIPDMPTATSPAPICSNNTESVTLTAYPGANGNNCRWYDADHQYLGYQTNNYGNSYSVSTNLYVTTINTTTECESEYKLMQVVINTVPSTPNNISNQSNCGAGTVTFTGTVSAPNTFRWYSADNTQLFEGGSFTTTLEETTNFTVTTVDTVTGCESSEATITATIHPAVAAPEVTTPQTLCGAGTKTLTATTAQGNSLRWYADAQGETELTANANGSYTTPALTEGQNSTYYVGAYNPNCSGPLAAVTVNVYANPTIENVTDNNRCGAGNVTIEATASTDAQVRWYEAATGGESIFTGSALTLTDMQAPSTNVRYAEAYDGNTGCYSSTRVPVTAYVYETYTLNDPQEACDSFVWNGQPYYTSGNYTQTLQTIHNCDSVVTLQLTINNTKRTTVDSTVCDAISWLGHNYTESDTYVDTLTAVSGCDSIVTLNLTVKRSTVSTDFLTLCSAQLPYDYNGYQVTQAGTFTVVIDNTVGCDSTITLTVEVNPTPGLPTITKKTRCGEGSITLQASAGQNGTTCYWYASENAPATDTLHSGANYQPSLSETTVFYVSSVNGLTNCASARVADTAIIYSVPTPPTVKDTARCGAGAVTLEVTVADPSWNVQWFANATTTNELNTGLQYEIQNLDVSEDPYQYYVRTADEHCPSSRVVIRATVNAIPPVPTVTAVTNCGLGSFSLTPINTTSCRWYETATATTYTETTPFVTGQISASTSYYVSNVNTTTGCESDKTEFPVTIYPVYEPVELYDDVCQGSAYTGHGLNVTYQAAGVQDITLATVSSNGCDSVVTLHLNVKPLKDSSLTVVACNSHSWNDSVYTNSGVYQQTFTAANGCDSVVTLNLTINRTVTKQISAVACNSYTWNESTYTTSGEYQQTFTAANGCDSVVTLNLTINRSKDTTIYATACNSYTWNDSTYTTTGVYQQTLTASNNCDSTVTLHLTVNYSVTVPLTSQVCAGTRYQENGFDTLFTTPGTYVLTNYATSQYGCDSTTNLTLTVNPTYNYSINTMICAGATYMFNGEPLTTAGTHVANLHTVSGCDSIVTLNLTVGSEHRDTIDAHVCYGGSYHQNNFNIDNAVSTSFYTNTDTSATGCDSITVLHLFVHELNTTSIHDEICLGETYQQNGFNITPESVGTITDSRTVQTFYNCDSTINLTLVVNPVYNLKDTQYTCQSLIPYHYEIENVDIPVTTAGKITRVFTHTTAARCDSNRTLTLFVRPSYYETSSLTFCANSDQLPYTFGDTTLATTGVYTHNFGTAAGCDSIVTLTFTVNPVFDTTIYMTVCDSVIWQNNTYRTSGVYPVTLSSADNCDSIVRLDLTVNYSQDTTINVTECDSYVWNDSTYRATGVYTKTFSGANGCDSVAILNLTINPSYDLNYTGTVCQGEAYTNYGFDTTFATAGIHTLHRDLKTVANCDSMVTVVVTVNPSYSKDTTVSVCDDDLPYVWNNESRFTYHTGGDKTITYQLATGCDSVIHLHLNVHQSFVKDTTIQICEGALPYVFDNNNIFPSQGNYTAELVSSFGCDSIYHVNLIVTPTITHTVTRNICDNELPFTFGDSTFTQAGQYAVVTSRADGCNEVTYLTLNVYPTYSHSTTLTICESELPYRVGDTTFTMAGTKTVHFSTAHSCDSAVTVTLIVNPEYAITDAEVVCQSATPYHYAPENVDIDINTPGVRTYTYSHKTVANCDSIVTFTLTVNPSYSSSRSVTLCANSDQLPYTFGDTALTTSGVYTYNFRTVDGCDSIETLTFTVKPVYDTTITASICKGDSYVENGFNLTPDSVGTHTYTRNLTSSLECDSTVNLVLTVNPTYYIPENVTVHSTTLPFLWHGHTLNESTTLYDSLTTMAGCDSVYYLTLTVTEFNIEHDNPIVLCEGSTRNWRNHPLSEAGTYYDTVLTSNTIYMVDVTVNQSYHLYDTMEVCDNELPYFWHERRFTSDSVLTVNYQTVNAPFCDSIYTLTFIVHPTYNIHEDLSVCESALPVSWHEQSITGPGFYTDSLLTAFGCDSIHTLTLNVTYVSSQEESVTVCGADATYAWHKLALSETGVYRDTLRNDNGCDSIHYTINFVKGLPFFQVDSIVLSGSQSYTWRGRQITAAGVYYDSLQTTVGCDSVYSLVAVSQEYQMIQSNPIPLCPGDTAIWNTWDDHRIFISEGGTYRDTVVNGSVIYVYTVVATMNQAYYFNDTVTICQNELPFVWHGVNRIQTGVYYDRLQTVNGCDSVYTLTLTVNPTYNITETQTICSNEAPYSWHGTDYYQSGVYYDSLSTTAGCDSIYKLTLTVNPAIRQNDTAETCQGTPYVWRGRQLQASGFYVDSVANTYGCEDVYTLLLTVNPRNYDTIRAAICLGDTYAENGFNVTPTAAGTEYDQLTLTNQYGCDSIVSLVLTVNSSYTFETIASTCDGTPYEWRGGEYVVEGTYYDRYETTTGCDSVYVLYLTVNPTYDIEVIDSVHLSETYDNYGIVVTPTDTGVLHYTVNNFTENGCDSIIRITLIVYSPIGVQEYVAPQLRIYPNPASTYVNIEGERMQTVYVYDIYGRLVQVQEVDSPEYTRLSLEPMAAGNYIIRIRLIDGEMISRKIIKKQM